MQITASFGKLGMLGVTEASVPPPVRLTSKTQGEPFNLQVLAACRVVPDATALAILQ
jgi:hypothetical protein